MKTTAGVGMFSDGDSVLWKAGVWEASGRLVQDYDARDVWEDAAEDARRAVECGDADALDLAD